VPLSPRVTVPSRRLPLAHAHALTRIDMPDRHVARPCSVALRHETQRHQPLRVTASNNRRAIAAPIGFKQRRRRKEECRRRMLAHNVGSCRHHHRHYVYVIAVSIG
jgi:hypothetical protein